MVRCERRAREQRHCEEMRKNVELEGVNGFAVGMNFQTVDVISY